MFIRLEYRVGGRLFCETARDGGSTSDLPASDCKKTPKQQRECLLCP